MEPGNLRWSVKDRETFNKYIKSLVNDLKTNESDWENTDLESFLFALASFAIDSHGWFQNQNRAEPPAEWWKLFAHFLQAASRYE